MKIRLAEIVFIALLSTVIFNVAEIAYLFLTGSITFSKFLFGLALGALAFALSFIIYLYFLYFEPIADPDTLEKRAEENNIEKVDK